MIKIEPDGENGEWLVRVGPCKLSYPHLYHPFKSTKPGQSSKYGAKLLLDRNNPEAKADALELWKKVQQMCKEKFKTTLPSDRLCLRDGKQLTEDLHGFYQISASESIKPIVVDRRRQPVSEEDGEEMFYPGANVIATLRLWSQDSKDWGKRINANLVALQYHSKGERLGGRERPNVDELFEDISGEFSEEDESEDDMDDIVF
jgi:hypothetical protein